MYDTLLDALRRGDAATALPAARALAAERPDDATAQRLLGAALRLSGDAEGALAALDAALALEPDNADLHLERAGLLLGSGQHEAARAALASSTASDPNQLPAYIMQAHLALTRGEFEEAERLARTAARVAPEHPQLLGLQGVIALRRDDADRALALLDAATRQLPDDLVLRHALGFAYLAKGHYAFAEQAFRRLLEDRPDWLELHALIADMIARQGRPEDAAQLLAPLLDKPDAAPGLYRTVGLFELQAGRLEQALPHLQAAFDSRPEDQRVLTALVETWQRLGRFDEARGALDQAVRSRPGLDPLWHARLAFESFASDAALAVIERWLQASPDNIGALQAQATTLVARGDQAAADGIAQRIVELEPGHTQAELRVVHALLRRDPAAAAERLQALAARAPDAGVQRALRHMLGRAQDAMGEREQAVATWAASHAEVAGERLALPSPAPSVGELPAAVERDDQEPAILLLWGAPGSLVERVAAAFELTGAPLRADRYGSRPPQDVLQRPGPQHLAGLDPAALADSWRTALPARGITGGSVIDWLLWWDNALSPALRTHLPDALVMFVLRDPRDMLLDWLAFGSPAPFALPSPLAGATWLAEVLEQVADVHERELVPHRLLRMDEIADDPQALSAGLGQALGLAIPPVDRAALGPPHFAPGRWREFSDALGDAFAMLGPVAGRLGYPAE